MNVNFLNAFKLYLIGTLQTHIYTYLIYTRLYYQMKRMNYLSDKFLLKTLRIYIFVWEDQSERVLTFAQTKSRDRSPWETMKHCYQQKQKAGGTGEWPIRALKSQWPYNQNLKFLHVNTSSKCMFFFRQEISRDDLMISL